MIDKLNCLQIGSVTKSHGINGEAAILLNEGVYSDQIKASFLFLDLDGGLVPFKVNSIRDKSDSVMLVKFDLCKDEKDIVQLIGSTVWIDKKEVTVDDENLTLGMLIGYTVVDKINGNIGLVKELRDVDRNPLFVVQGKNGEILIPVADEFITEIDDRGKVIYLTTPDGLLELYL